MKGPKKLKSRMLNWKSKKLLTKLQSLKLCPSGRCLVISKNMCFLHKGKRKRPKNLIITAEEKIKATKASFRSVQQGSFKEDKQTHLQKLNPFLDADGLLRARGRLVKSKDLTFAQKNRIILDGKHQVTGILLRNDY